MPAEPIKSKLQTIINDVADAHRSPRFEPHLTIISIQQPETVPPLRETLSPILEKHKDLNLEFQSLFLGTSYFISVALALKLSDSLHAFQRDVLAAFLQATASSASSKEFFPHISLFYGEIATEQRQQIAASIRSQGVWTGGQTSCLVDGASSCLPEEVWVVETVGKVEDWKVIEIIKMVE